jgi:hypothetical protein
MKAEERVFFFKETKSFRHTKQENVSDTDHKNAINYEIAWM